MRRNLVAGNWKMHGSRAENARADRGASWLSGAARENVDCVVCPPFVYLEEVARLLRDAALSSGRRTCARKRRAPITGEVSAAMLKDVGCDYVIVGHSERRAVVGERRCSSWRASSPLRWRAA